MKQGFGTQSCHGWETVVARSFEEIEAIRPIWERMQGQETHPVPNADIDHYLSVMRGAKESAQPYVMVVYYDGEPKTALIGRIEKQAIACAVGYAKILATPMRCLTVVYGGILGQRDAESRSMLMTKLMEILKAGEADVVTFFHLPIDSDIYRLVRLMPTLFCRDRFPVQELHWKAFLPGSFDDFLRSRSKNTRHNTRRYTKRLVEKYGDRLSVQCFTETRQVDQLFRDTVEVAQKTYQQGLGSTFVDDVRTRSQVKFLVDRKLLIAYVLYIDGRPCAFWNGIRYKETFFTWTTGYDPAFSGDRLGLFLLVKMIELLCVEPDIQAIDFGFGDAQYKQSFCDDSWIEASVFVFAPRLYPTFVNLLRSSVNGLNAGLKRVGSKVGALGWVKRQWRTSLRAKSSEDGW
jgi:CelD/BcsL family acetyltransferase involved in cellulose biosynthesis